MTEFALEFTVYGEPIPQGSLRAFNRLGGKFPIVTGDNPRTKKWRAQIGAVCEAEMERKGLARLDKPTAIRADVGFDFVRPASCKTEQKVTKPDLDKLLRSVFDALSGIAFEDDSQIVMVHATKNFAEAPRAIIHIYDWTGK